ncbi:DUF4258 domain-containing protein [Halobacillus rhizosphaerae]|uniref:DUF4258 domain-containing protein n=1 Tax=Halobacillus rhizosphaerae TaxID=3064889 RepID=UPI00398AD801
MLNKKLYFSKHILKRMAKRGMSKAIIEAVIDNGVRSQGKHPYSLEIEYKGIIVVLYVQKNQLNVSTCKLDRPHTLKAEYLQEKLDIDFWKAVHLVVKEIDLSKEIAYNKCNK